MATTDSLLRGAGSQDVQFQVPESPLCSMGAGGWGRKGKSYLAM